MEIGSPDKNKRAKKNYFSIKKGTSVFRILPPLGDLAQKGIWNRYYAVHFGYFNSEGRMRPFVSPEAVNRKTKMVEVRDAAKDRITKLLSLKESLKNKLSSTPDDIKAKKELAQTESLLERFNLDKKYYVNAMDQSGNIGLLKLKYREKNAVDAAREQIKQEEGLDPLSAEGVFLTFTKHGEGRESSVIVSANYVNQKVGEKTVKALNTHNLRDDMSAMGKLSEFAFDLDNLFVSPTAEEVESIVNEGPEAVDRVMSRYMSKSSSSQDRPSSPTSSKSDEDVLFNEEDAEMMTEEESPKTELPKTSSSSSSNKVAASSQSETMATGTAVSESSSSQSDEDFLKSMGIL